MDCVVAHPRSGTSFLAELLNLTGEVAAHEYLAAIDSTTISLATAFYEGRVGADSIRRLLSSYRDRPEANVRIDSNWKLAWILPVFLEAFPDARVVHLVRDPRDVVRSTMNLDYYGELSRLDEFRQDVVRNAWLAEMPCVRRADWNSLDQLGKNCAFWTETQRLISDALCAHPLVLRMRLEDLVSERSTVETVFDFFGLPAPAPERARALCASPVNDRSHMKERLARFRAPLPDFEAWPPAARDTLLRICGDAARPMGYEIETPRRAQNSV